MNNLPSLVQCGAISSVRIVRDAATGIGKGFGYVNFASEDSVEIALTLNGSELDGRQIRVSRWVLVLFMSIPQSLSDSLDL